jgi:hypothetical protein
MVPQRKKYSKEILRTTKTRTPDMTFPGIDADIKLLADLNAIDSKRNHDGEERGLDLIAVLEHSYRNAKKEAETED